MLWHGTQHDLAPGRASVRGTATTHQADEENDRKQSLHAPIIA